MTDIGVNELVVEARRWRIQTEAAKATVLELLEELATNTAVADHANVAQLVTTSTRRLLDGAAGS